VIVFAYISSPRLVYTLNVLFKQILKVDYDLTNDIDFFKASKLPKLNYSIECVKGGIQIIPSGFLEEKTIKNQNIKVDWVQEIPYFFKTGKLEYDVLAASFYMVSRYEEYLPFKKDVHQRFSAKESLAYQNNFLHLPVVNLWAKELKSKILTLYPEFEFPVQKTSFLNTLDIDVAYAYKGKPKWKFFASMFKNIIRLNNEELKNKIEYLVTGKDIYETYSLINQWSKNVNTIYFFLLGKTSKYDLNISPKKKVLQNLIKSLSGKYTVGIHPSYLSNTDQSQLAKEINTLEKILEEKVKISRQHFLKYGEQEQSLQIIPFMVMDGTLNTYLQLKPQEAIARVKSLIKQVNNVEGLFVCLWHNSSLCETHGWQGWSVVYKEILKAMK